MEEYEYLLICFRTGQMSEAQLFEHMRENAEFAAYVREYTA